MTQASVIRSASIIALASIVTGLVAAAPADRATPLANGASGQKTTTNAQATDPSVLVGTNRYRKVPSSDIVLPVHPVSGAPMWTGRLYVKFRDDLKVRASRGPTQFTACADGRQLPQVVQVLTDAGGTIRQALNRSLEDLKTLEDRAQLKSGRAQEDLASIMLVDVPVGSLLDTARAFNDLSYVEWVEIERPLVLTGGGNNMSPQYGCGQNGAGDDSGWNNCYTTGMAGRCSFIGGGNGCNQPAACEQDPVGTDCQFGCNNIPCCEMVADILPGCSDATNPGGWDALCATYANMFCNGNVYSGAPPIMGGQTAPLATYRYDPCFALRGPVDITAGVVVIQGAPIDLTTAGPGGAGLVPTVTTQLMTYTLSPDGSVDPLNLNLVAYPNNTQSDESLAAVASQAQPDPSLEGAQTSLSAGCFVDHTFVGCSQSSCCVYVCRNDPNCCTVEWDSTCVAMALAATSIADPPCTAPTLPPAIFDPAAVPSPLVTAGLEPTGRTRGYQAYTMGPAVLGPGDLLPAGIGPSSNNIFAPSVRSDTPTPPVRAVPTNNMGTLQFLTGGFRGGGYDLQGMEDLAFQLGLPAAATRGKGVTVAVIEFSAYVNHEDLINKCTPEAGQTQVLINEDPLDPNHGTACLGIIGAENNGFGVTGIAPMCNLRFYPTVSFEEGSRFANAITNALIDMGEGDIINISMGFGGGTTIPGQQPYYGLISVGTSIGITTVVSAGNDALPVATVPGNAPDDPPDSGAIVVGACWPGFQCGLLTPDISAPGPFPGNNYCRLNFSNFTDQEADRGGQVHVAAWGTAMTSTGYGDLFTGLNGSADALQVNKLRTYTASFNGTSSAAPMIAGLCARAQSFSEHWFGASLPPGSLRAAISTPVHQQCGIPYESPAFPGYPEDSPAIVGDLIPIGQGGQLAQIGGFPDARGVLAHIVSFTYGGPAVTFTVITGSVISGNQFSLRQVDGNVLKVNAVKKRAGSSGQGYGPALLYPFTGPTTDVQVELQTVQTIDNINTLTLAAVSAVSTSVPVVEIIYLYNRVEERWKSVGWTSLGTFMPDQPYLVTPWGDPRDYVIPNAAGGTTVFARSYTAGLAPGGYTVNHDLLVIGVNIDLMDAGGGGGGGNNP